VLQGRCWVEWQGEKGPGPGLRKSEEGDPTGSRGAEALVQGLVREACRAKGESAGRRMAPGCARGGGRSDPQAEASRRPADLERQAGHHWAHGKTGAMSRDSGIAPGAYSTRALRGKTVQKWARRDGGKPPVLTETAPSKFSLPGRGPALSWPLKPPIAAHTGPPRPPRLSLEPSTRSPQALPRAPPSLLGPGPTRSLPFPSSTGWCSLLSLSHGLGETGLRNPHQSQLDGLEAFKWPGSGGLLPPQLLSGGEPRRRGT